MKKVTAIDIMKISDELDEVGTNCDFKVSKKAIISIEYKKVSIEANAFFFELKKNPTDENLEKMKELIKEMKKISSKKEPK